MNYKTEQVINIPMRAEVLRVARWRTRKATEQAKINELTFALVYVNLLLLQDGRKVGNMRPIQCGMQNVVLLCLRKFTRMVVGYMSHASAYLSHATCCCKSNKQHTSSHLNDSTP
ncbi:unnamed protein product [Ceratitis capitata]|uniref:(Mediterranean fruit fly) hypothetical protein n=1 Tax=Ceratitis capitata TaxID=7213 RepID=A0A811V1A7_CERCA|nr:unnamed protein product [Ceratitis capitata]